jgi:hypothetical protein
MKTCSKCGIEKPLTEYHSAGIIDGKKYIRGECKVCQKKVVKARTKSIKEKYVSWKKTLKCNRCGFSDYRALQFHHHNEKEHIKKEADKCEVLCANCHQIHHSPL